MELREAMELMGRVAPNAVFERPYAEAFRVVMAEVNRVTTLVKCEGCDRGVKWRCAAKGLCPDCAAGELDRLTAERDEVIRRHVYRAVDPSRADRWFVEPLNADDDERIGPFRSEGSATAAVLAWVRWSIDPANNPPGPTEDEEESDR